MRAIVIAGLLSLSLLAACAKFVPAERLSMRDQVKTDKQVMVQDVAPIAAPLTIEEAIARALKYNLDRRSKEMELNLASGQYKAALFQMAPKVNVGTDYSARDNDRLTLNSGRASVNPLSQDRARSVSEFGASWNLLEFGLGYFNAKQAGERIQIAEERRRKAVYTLIQDVRSAYWRAACAQVMRDRIKGGIESAEDALEGAKRVEQERLRAPQDELAYQRQLLENLRMLEAVQQDLSTAQLELANLINAPLGVPMELKFDLPKMSSGLVDLPIETLEELALENNTDLRESHHQSQIARLETRKIMAQLFPSISFNVAAKYDTDSYQVNQNWNEVGVRLSYNLVSLFSAPTNIELGKLGVSLADQRRVMTQMAVLTQLHIARLNMVNVNHQLSRSSKIRELDKRLATLSLAREFAQTRGKLETISTNTSALLSEFRNYQSIAQMQVAESRLSSVVGLEFYAQDLNAIGLDELTKQIASSPDVLVVKIKDLDKPSAVDLQAEKVVPPAAPTEEKRATEKAVNVAEAEPKVITEKVDLVTDAKSETKPEPARKGFSWLKAKLFPGNVKTQATPDAKIEASVPTEKAVAVTVVEPLAEPVPVVELAKPDVVKVDAATVVPQQQVATPEATVVADEIETKQPALLATELVAPAQEISATPEVSALSESKAPLAEADPAPVAQAVPEIAVDVPTEVKPEVKVEAKVETEVKAEVMPQEVAVEIKVEPQSVEVVKSEEAVLPVSAEPAIAVKPVEAPAVDSVPEPQAQVAESIPVPEIKAEEIKAVEVKADVASEEVKVEPKSVEVVKSEEPVLPVSVEPVVAVTPVEVPAVNSVPESQAKVAESIPVPEIKAEEIKAIEVKVEPKSQAKPDSVVESTVKNDEAVETSPLQTEPLKEAVVVEPVTKTKEKQLEKKEKQDVFIQ